MHLVFSILFVCVVKGYHTDYTKLESNDLFEQHTAGAQTCFTFYTIFFSLITSNYFLFF